MKKIKSTSIVLKSGMLLSKEILAQMTAESQLFKLQYDTYPDGIIYGFEYVEEGKKSYLSSGLIKYRGRYYFSAEKISVDDILDALDAEEEIEENETIYAVLAFFPCDSESTNEGIVSECMQLRLCRREDMVKEEETVIVLEYQYHVGKRRPIPETDAEKLLKNQLYIKEYYPTFQHVNYSLPNGTTFSPYIFRLMQRILSEKRYKSDVDYALLFLLCQNKILSLDVLKEWFASYGVTVDMSDRKSIIKEFLKAVQAEGKKRKPVVSEPVSTYENTEDDEEYDSMPSL